jgi:DnaJ-class molecular chaperone
VVTLDEVINPKTVKVIKGEGMPVHKEPEADVLHHLKTVAELQKGDLYIKFDIQFPSKIHHKHKETIVNALEGNENEQ